MFLGGVKLALGLAFGSSLLRLLQAFPRPLLGSLLIFSGAQCFSSPPISSPCAPASWQWLWKHAGMICSCPCVMVAAARPK
jgi:hypothetical protein